MKGYKSKYDKAVSYVNNNYPKEKYTDKQRNNVFRQIFAKMIVGFATIGKVNGKLTIQKENVMQGINYKSKTQMSS